MMSLYRKSIYIAGPMRGKPFFNFPAFDAAHDKLEDEGWNAISPADMDREHGFDAMDIEPNSDWNDMSSVPFTKEECMERDLEAIKKSDAIYMLKGWQNSTGAQAEYWCAKWRSKEIYFQEEPQTAIFPVDAQRRKEYPVGTFIKDYFPNAIAALSHHSYVSQAQHGPTTNGAPMEWLKDKSVGDGNQIIRHYMEGDYENMAWRALELLERQLTNTL